MTTTRTRGPARATAFGGLALLAAVLLPGCGAATGDLTGTVTHKGKAVVSGSVTAVGSDGIPHGAPITSDGKYTLTALPVGEVTITVSSPDPTTLGRGGGRGNAGARGPEGRQPASPEGASTVDPEVAKKWFAIPADVGDPAKTPLRATVTKGVTTHNIVIP